jgi:hypothetical protein
MNAAMEFGGNPLVDKILTEVGLENWISHK